MLVIGFPLLRSTSAKVNISYGNSQVNPKVACHGTIRSRVGRLRMVPGKTTFWKTFAKRGLKLEPAHMNV